MVSTAQLCLYCKGGKNLCGLDHCPLMSSIEKTKKMKTKEEFFGPSPSVFVGRSGYPNVYAGPLGAMENKKSNIVSNPGKWFGMDYEKIIDLRSMVLRSKYKINVKNKDKFIRQNKLLAMAKKPTDIEMRFKGKPSYRMNFSNLVQPMGPSAALKKMKPTENISIKRIVERVSNDEIKAENAAVLLYEKGIDFYKIRNIFSVGALGLEENKKMVPTRWSIVAVQNIIANHLIDEIKKYPSLNNFRVYSSEFLNNNFIVLLMPGSWEFENFEAWAPGSFWSQNLKETKIIEDYEPFQGKKDYSIQGGGYYSSRMGITEGLKKIKRQGRIIVFREVYEGYVVPIGSWQILENVRNAFRQPSLKFSTKSEALKHIESKLRISIKNYIKQSKILRQKRISDFFS